MFPTNPKKKSFPSSVFFFSFPETLSKTILQRKFFSKTPKWIKDCNNIHAIDQACNAIQCISNSDSCDISCVFYAKPPDHIVRTLESYSHVRNIAHMRCAHRDKDQKGQYFFDEHRLCIVHSKNFFARYFNHMKEEKERHIDTDITLGYLAHNAHIEIDETDCNAYRLCEESKDRYTKLNSSEDLYDDVLCEHDKDSLHDPESNISAFTGKTGSGKTKKVLCEVKKHLEDNPSAQCFFPTPLISVYESIKIEAKKTFTPSQMMRCKFMTCMKFTRSVYEDKIALKRNDIVVYDEIHTTLFQIRDFENAYRYFYGKKLLSKGEIADLIEEHLFLPLYVCKTYIIDAFLYKKDIFKIQSIRSNIAMRYKERREIISSLPLFNISVLQTEPQFNIQKTCTWMHSDEALEAFYQDIEKKTKVILFCDAKKKCKEILHNVREKFTINNVCLIDSDITQSDDFSEIVRTISQNDVIIATASCCAGTNIEDFACHRKYIINYSHNGVHTIAQMIGRGRQVRDIIIGINEQLLSNNMNIRIVRKGRNKIISRNYVMELLYLLNVYEYKSIIRKSLFFGFCNNRSRKTCDDIKKESCYKSFQKFVSSFVKYLTEKTETSVFDFLSAETMSLIRDCLFTVPKRGRAKDHEEQLEKYHESIFKDYEIISKCRDYNIITSSNYFIVKNFLFLFLKGIKYPTDAKRIQTIFKEETQMKKIARGMIIVNSVPRKNIDIIVDSVFKYVQSLFDEHNGRLSTQELRERFCIPLNKNQIEGCSEEEIIYLKESIGYDEKKYEMKKNKWILDRFLDILGLKSQSLVMKQNKKSQHFIVLNIPSIYTKNKKLIASFLHFCDFANEALTISIYEKIFERTRFKKRAFY